jgi:hypothetical protein
MSAGLVFQVLLAVCLTHATPPPSHGVRAATAASRAEAVVGDARTDKCGALLARWRCVVI